MKPSTYLLLILTAALAGAGGWFAARHSAAPPDAPVTANTNGARKILFYQSAMHPWIKSDKPGNCTICGMKLTPVFEGDQGFGASPDVVTLSSNSITVINVQTSEVKRQPLARTLHVAGRIDDNDARHRFVSAYIDGRIDELAVNFVGAEVVENDPLATFYSPALLTAEREYLALLRETPAGSNTNASIPEQASFLAAAAQRLKRLGLSEGQIQQLAGKRETNSHTQILAPVTGTVVARFVYAGQYVKEGDKLFEIADFSTMWFQFDAYERDLAWLRAGQTVEITTPSLPGRTLTAPIAFIDPNLNEATRTTRVRVELPNPLVGENGQKRRQLFHRIYAEGTVRAEMPEVLMVPRSAVLAPGPSPVVYVDLGGGRYQQRKVRLGRQGDDAWEVLEGVSAGERVVTNGNLLIDAQVQLNAGGAGTVHEHGEPAAQPHDAETTSHLTLAPGQSLELLIDVQRSAAREALAAVDAVGTALASDKLAMFNEAIGKLHTVLPALSEALNDSPGWKNHAQRLDQVGHLKSAADLAAARKAFLPLSSAAAAFVADLRMREAAFASLKIFRCPMTDKAIPGAPKTAQWIQLEGPLRNPYFGAEMLDCGTEVLPHK